MITSDLLHPIAPAVVGTCPVNDTRHTPNRHMTWP